MEMSNSFYDLLVLFSCFTTSIYAAFKLDLNKSWGTEKATLLYNYLGAY